jgi:DNA (cytosine-5)-methyltransferase 1
MAPLRVLSLFAGIGGFDLGLERTGGFKTVAFCEIEPFAVRVLNKHWPEVPVYGDVRELTADKLAADGIAVDVISGGFPCQDISIAGRAAGLSGERSGLWSEIVRLARDLRPKLLFLENVSALLGRGLGDVLGDLASLGYDAEWHCIPASAVGAPHRRDRIWIIAYPNADSAGLERWTCPSLSERASERLAGPTGPSLADACVRRHWIQAQQIPAGRHGSVYGNWWHVEPDVGRVANGIPSRVDRLRCLGNAVVPQIPELIGRAILAAIEAERQAA